MNKILPAKRFGIIIEKQAKAIKEMHNHVQKKNNKFLLIKDVIEDAEDGEGENLVID